jgi:hypothetical protein
MRVLPFLPKLACTPRGCHALRWMRSTALDAEKRWRNVLGEHRFGELRETLLALFSAETGGGKKITQQ